MMKFRKIVCILCSTTIMLSCCACEGDDTSSEDASEIINSSISDITDVMPDTENKSEVETDTTTASDSEATTTTTKAPETSATLKPETTRTATKAPETTSIVTDTPDINPTGHCEGFYRLWGKTFVEIGTALEEQGWHSTDRWENETNGGKSYALQSEVLDILGLKIPINGCCYNQNQAIYFLFEVCSSVQYSNLNTVYGFQLIGGGPYSNKFEDCEHFEYNQTGEICPNYNDIYDKLKEMYGEPSKSRLEDELKVYLWSNTADGDIVLSNDITFNSEIDYNTVCLEFLQSGHKFSQERIDYHFKTNY